MRRYYVYILHCSDGSLYTGITNNPDRRLAEHNSASYPKSFVHKRRPAKMVYKASYPRPMMAIRREKQIKRWTRAKKIALIEGKLEHLSALAKKKF